MKPWQIRVTRLFHLSLEMLLLYLIVTPFYFMEGQQLPVSSFLIFVGTAIIFYQTFIEKYQTEKIGLILIPIIALIGMSVDFPLLFSVVIATIIFWRVLYHIKDNDPNEMALFIITFIIGIALYIHFYYLGKNELLLVIILVQFFFVILLKMMKLVFQSTNSATEIWTQVKWQLASVGLLSGITLFAIFFYDLLGSILTFVIQKLFYFIWMLGVPIIYLLSFINLTERELVREEQEAELKIGEELNIPINEDASTINLDIFLLVIGVIIVLIFLYFIFKKSGSFPIQQYVKLAIKEETTLTEQGKETISFFRSRPKNEIRRIFLDFEKWMVKHGQGRNYNETVEEWFSRLAVNENLAKSILTTYQTVRYGEKDITKADKELYRQALKDLKKEISTKG